MILGVIDVIKEIHLLYMPALLICVACYQAAAFLGKMLSGICGYFIKHILVDIYAILSHNGFLSPSDMLTDLHENC